MSFATALSQTVRCESARLLYGIVGATKARATRYGYSLALKTAGGVWSEDDLDKFLLSQSCRDADIMRCRSLTHSRHRELDFDGPQKVHLRVKQLLTRCKRQAISRRSGSTIRTK